MKKSIVTPAFFISRLFVFSMLLLAIILTIGCKKYVVENPGNTNKVSNSLSLLNTLTIDTMPINIPLDQLVIWKKPDSSNQQVREWIKKIKKDMNSDTTIYSSYCGNCDSSLLLLS